MELSDVISQLSELSDGIFQLNSSIIRLAAAIEAKVPAAEEAEIMQCANLTPPPPPPKAAPTFEEVRAACLQVHQSGQSEAVVKFLNAKGVKKLNELDPSDYKALLDVCAVCLMGVDRDYT